MTTHRVQQTTKEATNHRVRRKERERKKEKGRKEGKKEGKKITVRTSSSILLNFLFQGCVTGGFFFAFE